MKLPPGPFIDDAKLRDYCLNPNHPEGKHKARVFKTALGIGSSDVAWLRECLLNAAATKSCERTKSTVHGTRYVLDFTAARNGKMTMIRSAWIVRAGEQFPRLVTCYVL